MENPIVVVIIPAFNEENGVGNVIRDIPAGLADEVVVVNNNSTDDTSKAALSAGATVLFEPIKGYGRACLKGLDYLKENRAKPTDIVVFIDADYADYPEQIPDIIAPILTQNMDLVIGSRALGNVEKGAMTIPQRFGNALATFLLKLLFGGKFTDLGPFRAMKYSALLELEMKDLNFGWTVEMQIKVLKKKMRYCEIPVKYRNRIGFSKISGTVSGTIKAGYKILFTIFKYL